MSGCASIPPCGRPPAWQHAGRHQLLAPRLAAFARPRAVRGQTTRCLRRWLHHRRAKEADRDVFAGVRQHEQRVERELRQRQHQRRLPPRAGAPWRRRHVAGVPLRFAHRLVERALRAGLSVAVALEEPLLAGGVKRRVLRYFFDRPPVTRDGVPLQGVLALGPTSKTKEVT